MHRKSECYKPLVSLKCHTTLSTTSFKAAMTCELVAVDFLQQCLIAVHAFWTSLCCSEVAVVGLCGLMCSDICVPLSLSQHDPLTVDSIATSNESSAEPDSLLPSRSIFQPPHMICGARCLRESCLVLSCKCTNKASVLQESPLITLPGAERCVPARREHSVPFRRVLSQLSCLSYVTDAETFC